MRLEALLLGFGDRLNRTHAMSASRVEALERPRAVVKRKGRPSTYLVSLLVSVSLAKANLRLSG